MQQPNITIKDLLDKNKISYAISSDQIVIWCPICQETDFTGSRIFTFHINPEGKGECMKCMAKLGYEALLEKLGIPHNAPEEAKIGPDRTQTAEIEPNMAPAADTLKFEPLTSGELASILDLTIKNDYENKIVTFLCCLSAFTDNAQFNVGFSAPSSTGKSFIPLEIADLFPDEDVMRLSNCSPTAFYHEQGEYDKAKNSITVDLSRKIIVFMEQSNYDLLSKMRSLLSHDRKEIDAKITDKNQKGSHRTKTVIIKGYPSVIYCSASLMYNEQESTRFIFLSPEMTQEKLRGGIHGSVNKEADNRSYREWLESNPDRKLLKERVAAIREAGIGEINIKSKEKIEERFLKQRLVLKPRHQRDIKRIMSLTKAFALLNFPWREKEGTTIIANDDDIEEAFTLWDKLSEAQEYNISPFLLNLYKEVLLPLWAEKNPSLSIETVVNGLTRLDILKKHLEVYGRHLPDWELRQRMIPMWESAGLIAQEDNPDNKRQKLIYVNTAPGNSEKPSGVQVEQHSEMGSGVDVKSGEEFEGSDLNPSELFG